MCLGAWRLSGLDAAPKSTFGGEKKMLVKASAGIVISIHLPPPVMIESAEDRALVTHMLC